MRILSRCCKAEITDFQEGNQATCPDCDQTCLTDANTFGEYKFEEWIPEHTRRLVRNFWGQMGRTYRDWLQNPPSQGLTELCHHGPNPNGFGLPPNGAQAEYFIKQWDLSDQAGFPVYRIIEGRYVHRWNNMGSLIDADGHDHTVSTCDRWVRIFQNDEERRRVLEMLQSPKKAND